MPKTYSILNVYLSPLATLALRTILTIPSRGKHAVNFRAALRRQSVHVSHFFLTTIALAVAVTSSTAAIAASPTPPPDRKGMQTRLAACATCHGDHGQGDDLAGGGVYPRLAGQLEDYLYKQLLSFQSAKRTGIPPVTIMHRLLVGLPDSFLRVIAQHYHQASPPYPAFVGNNPKQIEQGRTLVRNGLRAAGVKACTVCHGEDLEGEAPGVPKLAGQYARYLAIQFEHWAQGARHNKVHEHIAAALSHEQVKAIAEYLASLRPTEEGNAE